MSLRRSFRASIAASLPKEKTEEAWMEEEPEDLVEEETGWMRVVGKVQSSSQAFYDRHRRIFKGLLWMTLIIAVHVYIVFACLYSIQKATAVLVLLGLSYFIAFIYFIYVPYLHKPLTRSVYKPAYRAVKPALDNRIFTAITAIVIILAVIGYFVYLTWDNHSQLVGLGGMAFFIALMWICSNNRFKTHSLPGGMLRNTIYNYCLGVMNEEWVEIRWRPVFWGFFLQFIMGLLVLRWPQGSDAFNWFSDQIVTFLDYTNNGTVFVYGFLAEPPNICGMTGVFAFTSLQVIIYFGSIVALLYYYGIMQLFLKGMAYFMQATLGTTATESLNSCACIFLGQSEAPLLIRPYLSKMTASELHAVMTSGFACIAGSLFAAYIAFGACPKYLLSSTVMSAPGSLACSKILFPETEESPVKKVSDLHLPESEESTPLECISNGAVSAVELVMAVVANLIVFLALLAFIDASIDYIGGLIGQEGWSLEMILGYIFFPLAYVMGVTSNTDETLRVARLMGTKTVLNEFIAYQQLGSYVSQGLLSPRAAMIATYALCGFSNFSSIGIQLGVLGGMAPQRKPLLAKIAWRALFAGSISCFYTAALAGVLVSEPFTCATNSDQANCFDVDYYQSLLNSTTSEAPDFITSTIDRIEL